MISLADGWNSAVSASFTLLPRIRASLTRDKACPDVLRFDQHQELATSEFSPGGLEKAFFGYSDILFGSQLVPDRRRIEVVLEGTSSNLVSAFD